MKKFVCEDCGKVFEAESKEFFSPECPDCGSYDTTEVDDVARKLAEYEASQEPAEE
jgi:predicted  nucleic acid-binding Zn-ribbon protein